MLNRRKFLLSSLATGTAAAHTRGYYTNEVADEAQSIVNNNYQGNFDRLLKIKKEYDPTNLFRLNANIRAV